MLGSHNIWKQVQRLDIVVEKSRIFIRAQLQRTRIVQRLLLGNRNQQRRFAGGIREHMVTGTVAAARLPVDGLFPVSGASTHL